MTLLVCGGRMLQIYRDLQASCRIRTEKRPSFPRNTLTFGDTRFVSPAAQNTPRNFAGWHILTPAENYCLRQGIRRCGRKSRLNPCSHILKGRVSARCKEKVLVVDNEGRIE